MKYRLYSHSFLCNEDQLIIAGNDGALKHIMLLAKDDAPPKQWEHIAHYQNDLCNQLDDYFAQKLKEFTFQHSLEGTIMQKSVWQSIGRISYGSCVSYSHIAQDIAKPKAIRAAASACGKNPIPIVIPCHRVLGKQGTLNGFAWGLHYKRKLLELENIHYKP